MKINDRIGLFVKIMFVNGHVVMGVIRNWENDYVLMVTTAGEVVEILNPARDISAIFYIKKENGELLSERSEEDVEPRHRPGDIEEMTEVAKIRAKTDLEAIRSKLLSPICSAGEVKNESQLSIVSSLKNNFRR